MTIAEIIQVLKAGQSIMRMYGVTSSETEEGMYIKQADAAIKSLGLMESQHTHETEILTRKLNTYRTKAYRAQEQRDEMLDALEGLMLKINEARAMQALGQIDETVPPALPEEAEGDGA